MKNEKVSKERFIALKIYFDRARMYLGYINFFLLNVVIINSFDNPNYRDLVESYKWIIMPVLFLVYTIGLIGVGYLDTKLGLRREEMRNNSLMNPVLTDLVETTKRIEEKVNSLESLKENKLQS